MIKVFVYLFIIYLGYRFLKAKGYLSQAKTERRDSVASQDADMVRDPECGTYFMKQRGVEARLGGQPLYFCSPECREKYLKNH